MQKPRFTITAGSRTGSILVALLIVVCPLSQYVIAQDVIAQDVIAQDVTAQDVIYVKPDATGAADGSSWSDAFVTLQDALTASTSGVNNIWVAVGTYRPDELGGINSGDRSMSFVLKDSVSLYGGFAGWETSVDERNVEINRGTLSGNIAHPDSVTDNSRRVISGFGISSATVIDGFIIRDAWNDNVEPGGGGIFLSGSSSPVLRNLTITENVVDFWGGHGGGIHSDGASEFVNVMISNNRAGGNGGGIMMVSDVGGSSVFMRHSVVENNHAGFGGGGFMVLGDRYLEVESSTFRGNSCDFSGAGGLHAGGDVRIFVVDSDFINNRTGPIFSTAGGGLSMKEGTLQGVEFVGNAAYCDAPLAFGYLCVGGGLYTSGSPRLEGVIFSGNHADLAGGGMYSYGGHPTFDGISFTGNTAGNPDDPNRDKSLGGGLFLREGSFSGSNIVSQDNSAGSGGGIAASGATINLDNVAFKRDSAAVSGGGLACLSTGYSITLDPIPSHCKLSHGIFVENEAGRYGGAVYMGAGELRQLEISRNAAEEGGGVYIHSGESTDFRDVGIRENVAEFGGGVFVDNGHLSMVDAQIVGNHSTVDGGGLLLDADSAQLVGVTFAGNEARSGGAIVIRNSSSLSLINASLTGNVAAEDGGAMWCSDGECKVVNSSFFGNVANRGGALSIADTLSIYNSILWGNEGADATSNEAFVSAEAVAKIGHSTVAGSALPAGFVDQGGNNQLDPLFIDPDGSDDVIGSDDDNLRLSHDSPLIDTGYNAYVPVDNLDADGDGDITEILPIDLDSNPRIVAFEQQEPTVDRGPYETERELAVEFVDAWSVVDGSNVTLYWCVRDLTGAEMFVVETSSAGDWVTVGRIHVSMDLQEYSFTIVSARPGEHLYRVVVQNHDGTISIGVEISLLIGLIDSAAMLAEPWPNPASGYANTNLMVAESQNVTVALYDLLGRRHLVVYTGGAEANQSISIRLDVRSLSVGLYALRVTGETFALNRKLVVVR